MVKFPKNSKRHERNEENHILIMMILIALNKLIVFTLSCLFPLAL